MKSPISINNDTLQTTDHHSVFLQSIATIQEHGLVPDVDAPLIALISGGCDSTALAYLLAAFAEEGIVSRDSIRILHVNHCLRGEESEEDAHFVERLAACLGLSCEVANIDVLSHRRKQGGSLEAVARILRYEAADEALRRCCREQGCPISEGRILTAHTLNDRVETYFMRSIVGTGPGGLASIPYRNELVVRPLLDCLRADIEDYVRTVAFGDAPLWREDASNACTDFFRNYVRHEIIPRALTQNPSLHQTLRHTMNLIADENALLTENIAVLIERVVEFAPIAAPDVLAMVATGPLFAEPIPIQRRLLYTVLKGLLPVGERLESQHIAGILARGDHHGFAIDLPGAVRVRNEYGKLLIFPLEISADAGHGTDDIQSTLNYCALQGLNVESFVVPEGESPVVYARTHAGSSCVFVDAEKLLSACGGDLNTLELRRIEPGDVLCPFGMDERHKKVQDILVDRKVSPHQRRQQMILLARNVPVWLVGIMLDDRFKVDESPLLMCIRFRDTVQV